MGFRDPGTVVRYQANRDNSDHTLHTRDVQVERLHPKDQKKGLTGDPGARVTF